VPTTARETRENEPITFHLKNEPGSYRRRNEWSSSANDFSPGPRSINGGITAAHVFAATAATLTMVDDNVRSCTKEMAVHHGRCAYETSRRLQRPIWDAQKVM
jgi:hypothetical protein